MADRVLRQVVVESKLIEVYNVTVPRDWNDDKLEDMFTEGVEVDPHHSKAVIQKVDVKRIRNAKTEVHDLVA